jgi:hypothetical protein
MGDGGMIFELGAGSARLIRNKGLIADPCKSLARGNRMGVMTPEALFTAALQLEAGWKVTECRFEGEPRRLLLQLDFEEGKRFGCPECGKLCPTHDTSTKRWRHLNFFQYECILEARVPRSNCSEHGVLSVVVPWAREGSGFTPLFEALVMLLCREMPMAAVSDTLQEHDTRLWRVAAHYVEAAHANTSWAKVRRISVDETSARRGHRYVTNVLDAETHDLLLMVEGRSSSSGSLCPSVGDPRGKRPTNRAYQHGHESGLSERSEPLLSASPDRLRSLSSYANGWPSPR